MIVRSKIKGTALMIASLDIIGMTEQAVRKSKTGGTGTRSMQEIMIVTKDVVKRQKEAEIVNGNIGLKAKSGNVTVSSESTMMMATGRKLSHLQNTILSHKVVGTGLVVDEMVIQMIQRNGNTDQKKNWR
jgi:hypothetical protein